jgi:hypothetical protein
MMLARNWLAASRFDLRELKIYIELLFLAHSRHVDLILRRQAYLPRYITQEWNLHHGNLSIFERHI